MHKETSSRVSTIAANILQREPARGIASPEANYTAYNALLEKAKILAASCMSQDETPGQAIDKSFIDRLRDERSDLSQKLEKLGTYIGKGFPGASERQKEMLVRQGTHMSEYLAVLDERIADLQISERSAPVESDDDGA
jgi:Fe-S cluster assembly ATPase SufC